MSEFFQQREIARAPLASAIWPFFKKSQVHINFKLNLKPYDYLLMKFIQYTFLKWYTDTSEDLKNLISISYS